MIDFFTIVKPYKSIQIQEKKKEEIPNLKAVANLRNCVGTTIITHFFS